MVEINNEQINRVLNLLDWLAYSCVPLSLEKYGNKKSQFQILNCNYIMKFSHIFVIMLWIIVAIINVVYEIYPVISFMPMTYMLI